VSRPDTLTLYYRMDPKKIVLLKSLLDGHEGLLVQRTHDPREGIVQLLVSPDFEREVRDLITALSSSLWMEPIPPPNHPSSSPF
jgi:hypothetical protein